MANRWGNNGNSDRLYFLGLQNHRRWWLQPCFKRHLLPGRKAMMNLDSILKNRDTADKGLYSQSYGFSSSHVWMWELDNKNGWVPKNDAFEPRCWKRLLRLPWTVRISNQSILRKSNPEYSQEGLMLKLKLQFFGHNTKTWLTEKAPDAGRDWRRE